MARDRALRPRLGERRRLSDSRRFDAPGGRGSAEPQAGAFGAEREWGGDAGSAPRLQQAGRLGEEGLGEQEQRVRPDRRQLRGAARREEADRLDAHGPEDPAQLVFHHLRQRARDEQRAPGAGRLGRQVRHQGGEAGILALGEGRLNAAAGVAEDADGRQAVRQPRRGAREVELDDLGGARPHEEQQLDVGAPLDEPGDDAVELVLGVGEAGEVAVIDDGGGEARLREDHHASSGLQEVRAGARADD